MKKIRNLLKTDLFRTVSQLYIVQMASFALPLVAVPYLARHLGASGVGLVATFQALGNYFATVNEYGFSLSAMRDAARCKEDKDQLSGLFGSVIGAKILLGMACGAVMLVLSVVLPSLRNQHLLLASALVYTFGQSCSVLWLYQATGRITLGTIFDFSGRVLGIVGIFIFVKSPADAWLALAIPGASIVTSSALSVILIYRHLPFSLPSFASVFSAIRRGYAIFLSRCVSSLMNSGNALILSIFRAPAAVGYYSGAERIFKAGLTGLYPFSQVMFPRIAWLLASDRARARSEVLKSLALMLGAASLVSATMIVLDKFLVHLLLGPAFGPSVAILKIFAIVPVFRAISDVLGLQWMISHGLDKEFTVCLAIAGFTSAGLALLLSKYWGENGAAWSVVISEVVLAAAVLICVGFRRITPIPREGLWLKFARVAPNEGN